MLAIALILDAVLGEPARLWRNLPHPVVVMGRATGWGERLLNRGALRKLGGAALLAGLALVAGLVGAVLSHPVFGGVLEVVGAAILIAHRSLIGHVRAVADGLRLSLAEGRREVARIVGRDTAALDETGVSRAAIESAAENFSDGVVAPAFWFLIAGLPGIVIYKVINTADSVIGHRNARYREFGWAAARVDDLANWLPARLSAAMICVVGGGMGGGMSAPSLSAWAALWADVRHDANLHRSPNAGWPEAAAAHTLGVALSGPRAYEGRLTGDPFVNPAGRAPDPDDIDAACDLLWRAWAALLAVALLAAIIGAGFR